MPYLNVNLSNLFSFYEIVNIDQGIIHEENKNTNFDSLKTLLVLNKHICVVDFINLLIYNVREKDDEKK